VGAVATDRQGVTTDLAAVRVGRWLSLHARVARSFDGLAAVPFYPAVLAFVFVANSATVMIVPVGSLGRPAIIGVAVAVGLLVVLGLLLRDRDRGAFAAMALIFIPVSATQPWLMPAMGIAVAVAVLAIEARLGRIPWRTVTGVANAVSLGMLLALVGRSIVLDDVRSLVADVGPASGLVHGQPTATDPDIIVIMLDGHPRTDTLLDLVGVDDGEFVAGLRSRGFHVASRSHSNYTFTMGTLASTFQMQPLDALVSLDDPVLREVKSKEELRDAIGNGPVLEALRRHGYEIVAVGSGYVGVDLVSADRRYDTGGVTEFEIALIRLLGLPVIIDNLAPTWLTGSLADRIDDNLALVPVIAAAPRSQDRPRFVFVHIPSPHAPAVFRADGSVAPGEAERLMDWDRRLDPKTLTTAYAAHLAVLDGKVLATLDALDAVPSDRERIVLVFSDHGSRLDAVSDRGLREHAANLFASRFPDGSDPFGERPATINLFPVLLDHLFDAGLPLRPDRITVSTVDEQTWMELPVAP
jgi:sulfatase-like protein